MMHNPQKKSMWLDREGVKSWKWSRHLVTMPVFISHQVTHRCLLSTRPWQNKSEEKTMSETAAEHNKSGLHRVNQAKNQQKLGLDCSWRTEGMHRPQQYLHRTLQLLDSLLNGSHLVNWKSIASSNGSWLFVKFLGRIMRHVSYSLALREWSIMSNHKTAPFSFSVAALSLYSPLTVWRRKQFIISCVCGSGYAYEDSKTWNQKPWRTANASHNENSLKN